MQKWEEFNIATPIQGEYKSNTKSHINKPSDKVEEWLICVDELYCDYHRRIQVESWQNLMKLDVCRQDDTLMECNIQLLEYIREHIYIPHKVFNFLENFFMWEMKKEELLQYFPYEYLDYIITNAKYEDRFRYDLFDVESGMDFDSFIVLYFRLERALEREELKSAKVIIEKMLELHIPHPDFTEKRIQYAMAVKEYETAQVLCNELLDQYPEDYHTLLCIAKVAHMEEDYNRALIFYARVLEERNEEISGIIGMADCYLQLGSVGQALLYVQKAKEIMPYDGVIHNLFVLISKAQEKCLEEELKEDTLNEQLKLEIGKSYVNAFEMEHALVFLENIDENLVDRIDYHYTFARCYLEDTTQNAENAIPHLLKCMEWDQEEVRYYEDLAYCYTFQGKYEKAFEMLELAKEIDINSVRIYVRAADIFFRKKEYNKVLECCEQGIALDRYVPVLYYYKAKILHIKKEYNKALSCINLALSIMMNQEMMLLKTNILNDMGRWQVTIDYVIQLEKKGIWDSMLWVQKALALKALGKTEEAKYILLDAVKKQRANENIYYELGVLFYEQEEYDKALAYMEQALDKNSSYSKAIFLKGRCYQIQKQYEQATKIYLDAIEKGMGQDVMLLYLGDMYADQLQYVKALDYYTKFEQVRPETIIIHGRLCDVYIKMKNYRKALEEANLQIEIHPTDYDYINRGIIYTEIDCLEQAKKDYEKAIEISPKNCYAWNNLAYLAVRLGEKERIEYCFLKAYEYHHPGMGLYYQLGYYYDRIKEYEKAILWYDRGRDAFPEQEGFLICSGKSHVKMKQYDAALTIIEKYGATFHQIGRMHCYLGELLEIQGLYDMAEKEYQNAESSDISEKDKPALRLGRMYLNHMHNPKKAIFSLKKAYRMNRRNCETLTLLGQAYEKIHKDKIAKQYYWECLDVVLEQLKEKPKVPCIHAKVGITYARVGQYEKALKYLVTARELGPGCPTCKAFQCYRAIYYTGETFERMGKYEKALSYYRQAEKLNPEKEEFKEAVIRMQEKIQSM